MKYFLAWFAWALFASSIGFSALPLSAAAAGQSCPSSCPSGLCTTSGDCISLSSTPSPAQPNPATPGGQSCVLDSNSCPSGTLCDLSSGTCVPVSGGGGATNPPPPPVGGGTGGQPPNGNAQPSMTQDSVFVPLAPVPGLTKDVNPKDLAPFFNHLYKYAIGIAAVLAILQIIHGGFMYMTTESVGNKTEGKNLIVMSLLGLLLVLLPYLVFSIINPGILNLSAFNTDVGNLQPGPASQ